MRQHSSGVDSDGGLKASDRLLERGPRVVTVLELAQCGNDEGAALGKERRHAFGIELNGAIRGKDRLFEERTRVAAAVVDQIGPPPVEMGQTLVNTGACGVDGQRAIAGGDRTVEGFENRCTAAASDFENLGPAAALALVHAGIGSRDLGSQCVGAACLVEQTESSIGVTSEDPLSAHFEEDVALEPLRLVKPLFVRKCLTRGGERFAKVSTIERDQCLGVACALDRRIAAGAKVGHGGVAEVVFDLVDACGS